MRRAACQHERLLPFARDSLLVRLPSRIVPDSIPSEQMQFFESNLSSFFVSKSEHCHNELVASFDSGPLKCLRAVVDRPSYVLAGAVSNARTPHAKRRFLHRSLSDAPKALPCGIGSCERSGVLDAAKFGQMRSGLHRPQIGDDDARFDCHNPSYSERKRWGNCS
jgi:hypothetical protein